MRYFYFFLRIILEYYRKSDIKIKNIKKARQKRAFL